jgi:hypothetical protein
LTETPKKEQRINISMDESPIVQAKNSKISDLESKLGEANGRLFEKECDELCKQAGINKDIINSPEELPLIRKLAEQKRLENSKEPQYGETALWSNESTSREYKERQSVKVADIEGSDVPVEWVKANSIPELINTITELSHKAENKEEYQRILSRMTKKLIHNSKPLDMTFTGSNTDFIKTPKIIGEFDSNELREKKEAYNNRLRMNRCQNWKNTNGDF